MEEETFLVKITDGHNYMFKAVTADSVECEACSKQKANLKLSDCHSTSMKKPSHQELCKETMFIS